MKMKAFALALIYSWILGLLALHTTDRVTAAIITVILVMIVGVIHEGREKPSYGNLLAELTGALVGSACLWIV